MATVSVISVEPHTAWHADNVVYAPAPVPGSTHEFATQSQEAGGDEANSPHLFSNSWHGQWLAQNVLVPVTL